MIRSTFLSVKILLLAALNILLLASLFFLFARVEFQFNFGSFLLSPAKQTIASISRLIALDLPNKSRASWDAALAQYSMKYPAQIYLFDQDARQLAGAPVRLPSAFTDAVRRDPFARVQREGRREPWPPPGQESRGEPPFGPPPSSRFPHDWRQDRRLVPPLPLAEDSRFSNDSGLGLREPDLALMRSNHPVRYWVGVRVPLWLPGSEGPIHATLVWQIRSLWTEPFFFDYRPWLGVVLAILVTLAICWLPLIRDLNRAIHRLTVATGEIATGNFEVKLPIDRQDELGRLSESINSMAQRLSGYVYGQKRFLGDIAHELSSPIARIEVGLGILHQRTTADTAGYLADVQEDVDHMASLVSELLAFSKSQTIQTTATLGPVELAPLVQRVVEREGAKTCIVDRSVICSAPVTAAAEFLERALANVMRNAVRYAGGELITVSAQQQDQTISIIVSDAGPGLPDSELENVFRPFYRPEFARQSATGGTGLGLAIVRDCIQSCGGSVLCRNRFPSGLEVVINLRVATRPFTNA